MMNSLNRVEYRSEDDCLVQMKVGLVDWKYVRGTKMKIASCTGGLQAVGVLPRRRSTVDR
jgi:hypothetical protein